MARQLYSVWPQLEGRLPVATLAELPTPVRSLELPGSPAWVKRDDLTSPLYGGNKVRTLEVLFGAAIHAGATHVFSTGAFGSNHATATIVHAPRVGLVPGAILFPQPDSPPALENLRVTLDRAARFVALPHWSALPFGMALVARSERRQGHRPFVMVPGGATPAGALGYVGAAFELALQIEQGALPRPSHVVVGVGSTCTSAGLLLGLTLAARTGRAFVDAAGRPAPPLLVSVRVTPWPVTSATRIVGLAVRTSRLLAELTGDPRLLLSRTELAAHLRVDGAQLGRGYGLPTLAGRAASDTFHAASGPPLDGTYSEKAAAGFLETVRAARSGTVLFWATKSSAPLPVVSGDREHEASRRVRAFIERAARSPRTPDDQLSRR